MMNKIPESDWKKIRAMKDDLLNSVCEAILDDIATVIEDSEQKSHQAYLKLWKILNKEDTTIVAMFDDIRRSNAIHKLVLWYKNKLISDDDISQFSEETQEIIAVLKQY
jgi:Cdc6-like AAA superfamily ATPase